ncbi:hypothetical protein [Streptomyces sp. NPDC057623]|uniref:hypothetical protein n=1 Tax=Streptomyces sp. NPDC057623 TaxID=3346187 RepID=UPI00369C27F6
MTVNAAATLVSVPPYRTATPTAPGSSAGTTTESTTPAPAPGVSTGTPGTGRPPMLTLPPRGSSAGSK